ncbi:MAG: tRNA pseudouridine(13) synthase TruD [Candidatus Bathyarchaeia archaeon]
MEVYLTEIDGVGGTIKERYDDFVVEEVLHGFGKATLHIKDLRMKRGEYLLCVVSRRGWETLRLVSELARRLGIPRGSVGFAGFKDKRAYVKQFISLGGVEPAKVEGLNFNNVKIYLRGFMDEPLSSRLLMGNKFTITVRDPSLDPGKAQGILEHICGVMKRLGGFLNFYGYQRFGSVRPVTHLVGRLMVKRKFDEAIRLYLGCVGSRESGEARAARLAFMDGERLEEAYRLFPRKFIYERMILRRLMKFPEDYLGALKVLPLGLRRLFINAYQGYLFNRLLSLRVLEDLPLGRALEGDWILCLTPKGFDASSPVKADGLSLGRLNRLLAEGKASLAIPVLGYLSELSDGEMGMLERRILEEEGISSLKSFYIGALPEASGRGSLRPILAPFRSFNFEVLSESLRFTFFLYKECYASMLLREFMKPRDPVAAGF